MASASLGDELSCSICLNLYTEPVTLKCGHNFCKSCIAAVLDTQEKSGVYSCPECRDEYPDRPVPDKNRKLCNIVESFQVSQAKKVKMSEIFCTYCVDVPVLAAKTCLHCEISMCDKHLLAHNKSVDHLVTDPTSSFEDRKCSKHKEFLKYYCPEDEVCICMSCWVAGDHKGHNVELLDEAAEKKKETLRDAAEKLKSQRQETERRIHNLESHRTAEKGKAADVSKTVNGLLSDIRRQLDDMEKRVQTEVSRQEEQTLKLISDLIGQLEIQKDELSRGIKQIEELDNITDSLTVLKKEIHIDDITHTCDDIRAAGSVEVMAVLQMFFSELLHITNSVVGPKESLRSDLLLDVNTAHNSILISADLRSASYTNIYQNRPEGPERFTCSQVLSTQSFSTGEHYWEVDVSGAEQWLVGVAAHSIERKIGGNESFIGFNSKSWGLMLGSCLKASHNNKHTQLGSKLPLKMVLLYLNYEAGRLSFYQLGDPIRHLHTFTTTFTEPLHAAFCLFKDSRISAHHSSQCASARQIIPVYRAPSGESPAPHLVKELCRFRFFLILSTMASAALRDELSCSICLNLYTEPVTLRCGHSFCRLCIGTVLNTQEGSGVYTCPECREEYPERPVLEKNRKLCNIVEQVQSTGEEMAVIFCTYCDHPERAVKTCLQCESDFCEKHLRKHNKSGEHVLVDSTGSLEVRKCSRHREALKYYCLEDLVSICVSCCLAGHHRGHEVELLNETSERKKEDLKKLLGKLNSNVEEIEKAIQNLRTYREKEKEKAAAISQRVSRLFDDFRRKLDVLEWQVLCEIFKQEKEVSQSVANLVGQLETQKDELSEKIQKIEDLCNISDPLSFLEKEELLDKFVPANCNISGEGEARSLDPTLISQKLYTGLLLFTNHLTDLKIKRQFSVMQKSDALLDINSAHNNIILSPDFRSAIYTDKRQERVEGPERFRCRQVISTCGFSSGKHYWEVDVSLAKKWLIGVAARSMERKTPGSESKIGYNNKSWGVYENIFFRSCHNNIHHKIKGACPVQAVGIYLDYDAGLLSFYQLNDPIRHLYTFTTTFTEPLHAAFYLDIIEGLILGWNNLAIMALVDQIGKEINITRSPGPIIAQAGPRNVGFQNPPVPSKRIKLSTETKESIMCTYCDSPESAQKTCVQCEASFCAKHLEKHSKLSEHILIEPTASLMHRKCTLHKEALKYHCIKDDACICMSCWATGKHKGHEIEPLDVHAKKKKESLKQLLEMLQLEKQNITKNIFTQRVHSKSQEMNANAIKVKVTAKTINLKTQLDILERKVLSDLSDKKKLVLHSASHQIGRLNAEKQVITRKIEDVKELCNVTDPLTFLIMKRESGITGRTSASPAAAEGRCLELSETQILQAQQLADDLIKKLQKGDFAKKTKSEIILDKSTAHCDILVSDNLRTASYDLKETRPCLLLQPEYIKEHFKSLHIMSISSFSSGNHYWEVDVKGKQKCIIGVAYHSLDKKSVAADSCIGQNDKSWGLYIESPMFLQALHNGPQMTIATSSSVTSFGISLKYDTGRLTFYRLTNPRTHIYSFSATFTEPLHAAFYLYEGSVVTIREYNLNRTWIKENLNTYETWNRVTERPQQIKQGLESVCLATYLTLEGTLTTLAAIQAEPSIRYIGYSSSGTLRPHSLSAPDSRFHKEKQGTCEVMASAELREELGCAICLELYKEPVSLRCGHNFCRSCIMAALDTQEEARVYSCPQCREEYAERPQLEKNRTLCNIVEHFKSQPEQENAKVFCTFCDDPVPATKTCLQCETSLCDNHLKKHNKSLDHILIEPTASFTDRKCSVHKEILKYHCPADGASICMSCWVAGDHKGHHVELLDEAAEKKKETLRDAAEKLKSQRQETERRIQNLESHRTAEKGKAADVSKTVNGLLSDIRRQLDDMEKRVQTEVSRQEEQISQLVTDLIGQLGRQKDEMSAKIKQMEELCNIKDPLIVLKKETDSENNGYKSGDITSDVIDAGCLDEGMILQMLHMGLIHFADSLIDLKIKRQFPVMEKSDITLDIDTAQNNIIVSEDLRSASYSATNQKRLNRPLRFKSCQVLSTHSFSSGRHYWEVDVSGAEEWLVGVAAHSIERKKAGKESFIGCNDKSWGLTLRNNLFTVHNNIWKTISPKSSIKTVGIYLEYEAGRLSFYQLCDPIRHLHTFTTTFTEPLYAAFFVFEDSSIRIIK
ncbi:uncharacterized protein PAF06_013951 [Gastrophryne carolinensis]